MEPASQRGASEAEPRPGGQLVARLVRRLAGALVASAPVIVGCGAAAAAAEAPTDGAAEAITTIDLAATALAPGAPGAPLAPTTPATTTPTTTARTTTAPKTTDPLVPGAPPVSDLVATPKPEAVDGAIVSSVPQLDARTVKDEVSEAKGIADAALTPVSSAVNTIISRVRDVEKAVDGATDEVVEAVTPVVDETVPEGTLPPSDDVDAQEATDADRPASSGTTSAVSSAAWIDDAPLGDGGAPEPAAPAPADLAGLVVATSHAGRDLGLFPLVTPRAGGVMSDPRPAPALPFDTPATGGHSSNRSRAPPKRSDSDREVAVVEDPPATPRSPGATNIDDEHDDVPDRTDPVPTSPA